MKIDELKKCFNKMDAIGIIWRVVDKDQVEQMIANALGGQGV